VTSGLTVVYKIERAQQSRCDESPPRTREKQERSLVLRLQDKGAESELTLVGHDSEWVQRTARTREARAACVG
jgi:hypothetical protein